MALPAVALVDEYLLQQVVDQDSQAFSSLYGHFSGTVYSLAMMILHDEIEATAITEEIFLALWQNAITIKLRPGGLSNWLHTTTRQLSIAKVREKRALSSEASLDKQADENGMNQGCGWDDQLPAMQTQIIELAFFQGMTHHEIAMHLALPLGVVKEQLRSGLQTLRKLL